MAAIAVLPAAALAERLVALVEEPVTLCARAKLCAVHAVDFAFSSLALWAQHRAIAVILSGAGSDGAAGVREIKGQGRPDDGADAGVREVRRHAARGRAPGPRLRVRPPRPDLS